MSRRYLAIVAVCSGVLCAQGADAHFRLEAPTANTEQNVFGDPQKSESCGPSDGGTPTGIITTYQQGDTITITIDEKIFHPGHYRVALAQNDPSELPLAPPITPGPGDECASTVIQNPPVFPVLADGMLPHDEPFDGPQSFDVTLPSDITCDNCTLQVIQYMSSHAAPCFYFHCADIALQEGPVMTTSSGGGNATSGSGGSGGSGGSSGAGIAGGDPIGMSPARPTEEGCSCSNVGANPQLGMASSFALAALLLASTRRRS